MIAIRNNTSSELQLHLRTFAAGELYEIPERERAYWADNDDTVVAIVDGKISVFSGGAAIQSIAGQVAALRRGLPVEVVPTAPKNEYDLRPYGAAHKHIDSSQQIFSIVLSNKVGTSYAYSCSVEPELFDCITDDTSETIDGVLAAEDGVVETFFGRHDVGTKKLCKPVNIDYRVGDGEHELWQLWGAHVDFADFGEDDLVRLQIVDRDGVGVSLGWYSQEEFDAAGEIVVKEYDECFVRHLAKVGLVRTPDGAPGNIVAGLYLRAKYYAKDATKTDVKCWLDYVLTVRE